jgi:hypothetical protein
VRKRHDDPFELDELILHVSKRDSVSEAQLTRELNEQLLATAEFRPDSIFFYTNESMRARQGVGSEMKERKIVDHRPQPGTPLEDAA